MLRYVVKMVFRKLLDTYKGWHGDAIPNIELGKDRRLNTKELDPVIIGHYLINEVAAYRIETKEIFGETVSRLFL